MQNIPLRKRGLRCRRPYKGIVLTANHARARLDWAKAHLRWAINEGVRRFSRMSQCFVSGFLCQEIVCVTCKG